MVGAEGFEPPALCSQSRCATRLRYAPTFQIDCIANRNGSGRMGELAEQGQETAWRGLPGERAPRGVWMPVSMLQSKRKMAAIVQRQNA
jgi:hypothetical protein